MTVVDDFLSASGEYVPNSGAKIKLKSFPWHVQLKLSSSSTWTLSYSRENGHAPRVRNSLSTTRCKSIQR